MSDVLGSSITKGVFVFKGKKSKADPKDYVGAKKRTDEGGSDCRLRMLLFEDLWQKTSSKIELLQADLNAKVADDLLDFVQKSHGKFESDGHGLLRNIVPEIPTAALVTGVNIPDHGTMFANLTSMLKKRVTPHVAVLRSIRCQTVHSIISDTVSQLLDTSEVLDDEDEDDDDDVGYGGPPQRKKKRTSTTMSSLTRWFKSLYEKQYLSSEQGIKQSGDGIQNRISAMKSPQKGRALDLTRGRDASPLLSPTRKLEQMTLRSPRKNDLFQNQIRSPSKRTTNTPQKSRTSPRKAGHVEETPSPPYSSRRKTGKDLQNTPQKLLGSPRKRILYDSPKSPCGTPKKKASADVDSTPQKQLRSSARKINLDEAVMSPQKAGLDSPSKSRMLSPRKAVQALWSSPRKVLPESPQSLIASPKASAISRSKRRLDCGEPVGSVNPVVIVIEDFEGFPSQVLQDFITICGHHLDEIPLVLVFGIATTQNAVHRVLPHSVSSMLSMEKFQAPPSSEYLTQVLTQVLMTDAFPYKLSGKVFNFLLDIFLYHDFSVVGFIQALKYSMLEHYYSNPSSILCQNATDDSHFVSCLSPKQLDDVRSCMSFRRFVEGQAPVEQIKLLEDNSYAKKVIAKFMESLEVYHASFYPVMLCLHVITNTLPHWPLGKQLRELYAFCLAGNIFEMPEYEHAFTLIRSLSRNELQANLRKMSCHLAAEEGVPSELTEVNRQLCRFCDRLDNINELMQVKASAEAEESSTTSGTLPQKLDMYTLKQKLQEMDKKKKPPSSYEVLRKEAVDYLDGVFRKYLRSYKTLVLHEVLYFDGLDRLRQHINATPRATMQNALRQPFCYLPNDALNLDSDQLTSNLPDICIVYKLHLECGRLINLYDWLQAFLTVVQSETDLQDNKKSVDRVLQARFIRAVSELQFLGFIKPTRRKTDHVARLTWGGY